MKALKLFWSRGRKRNSGDWFSPLICECLSGRPVTYADPRSCDLVAVGSLLGRLNKSHRLHRLGQRRSLDIWGTGSLRGQDRLQGNHRLHAVRGRLTLARCESAMGGAALGDPGLLAQALLQGSVEQCYGIGVIPHLADLDHPQVTAFLESASHARLLDVTSPVKQFINEIARCERILSSSLHGLVFADALGIPNRWFTASGALVGGRHKFEDYYSAFGIETQPLRLADADSDAVFEGYRRPGLDALKRDLLASFPYC